MKWDKKALVTEILAHMAGNIGYSECIALVREKGTIANGTFAIYWKKAQALKDEMEDKRREEIAKKHSNSVISVAKKGIKTKNAKIIEIENEIEELLGYIKQGYIERTVEVNGKTTSKTEVLMTAELRHLHTIIETKRDRLSKLLGEYAPQQKEVKKVKELTEKTPSIIVTNARYSNSTIGAKGQQSTDNKDQ